jgi:hypothetical protein
MLADPGHGQISFTGSDLQGANPSNPTTLQFGHDGRLYVGQQDGTIQVYTISRDGPSDYEVTETETIYLIQEMPNHNDDGSPSAVFGRQVTGLLVAGTPSAPVLYVTSSDPRIGAGGSGTDTNLDTNSGVISRLEWTGTSWEKVDLVSGLPRSEENHSQNGMELDEENNILYVTSGGNTNAGAPSNNFAFATEYALAAAILRVDLDAIEALPVQFDEVNNRQHVYDLPTLDDPTRPNDPEGNDPGDPFGGNDGLNQARLLIDGPVQVYSPGWRNAYDVVITRSPGREGRMYTVDNGANGGWGGHPDNEGPSGNCTNDYVLGEPGFVNNLDNLHLIPFEGYYGGHPTPIRGNPSGAGLYWYDGGPQFDPSPTVDWPPVPPALANPIECDFLLPGAEDGALATFVASTNGLVEYRASNFDGQMQGDLLTASFDNTVYRMALNEAGDQIVTGPVSFASNFGAIPLDVTAQGDLDVFPGTVWVAVYASNKITAFEPADYDGGGPGSCTGDDDELLDEDLDGYSNADEIDNGSDPCSAASRPPDSDGDLISDLNDTDDDNDGIPDTADPFAIDPDNGQTTDPPLVFELFNGQPGTGFFGVGFTGLMTNGSDYGALFDPDIIVAGGAAGLFTIEQVSQGDALGPLNTQTNALQFGVGLSDQTGPFNILARLVAPFFNGETPQDFQSQGVYLGTGDQDNYVKIALNANGGSGGIQVVIEQDGAVVQDIQFSPSGLLSSTFVDLYLAVDPATGWVQPSYASEGIPVTVLGTPLVLDGTLLNALSGQDVMAVGAIATARGAAPFAASWDFIEIFLDPATSQARVQITPPGGINASTFTPGSFQIENTSQEGQQITAVRIDLSTSVFPDMVFDPDGTAGDLVAKGFTVDSDAGVGLVGHSFTAFHNDLDPDDGYDVLEIQFTDFAPGEVFTFSIDNDPTSIKGSAAPGPGESGSVSGLELAGATVAVEFDDGFTHTVQTFQTPGSVSGSENMVRRGGPPKPGISALGIPEDPVVVSAAQQTLRVSGPGGTDVSLLVVEGALYTQGLPGGGYDLDPFEANTAILVQEINAVVSTTGFVDIPITLTDSDPNGGLNYIVAVLLDTDGMTGRLSDVIELEYDPAGVPALNINAGGPAVGTGGAVWSADQFFTGSGATFSNAIPIQGTTDDVLYHTERYGSSFGYAVSIANGTYTVNLHFAEIYFGAPGGGPGGPGSRTFDVDIENGQGSLLNFDILAEASPAEALVKTFEGIVVTDGALDIAFTGVADNAKVSAIEILEGSPGAPAATLQVIPALLDFGPQGVGSTMSNPVALTNTGDTALEVTDITITGPDAAAFSMDLIPPFAVEPGSTELLTVDFTPQTEGPNSATLTVAHTGDNPPVTVNLIGQGVEAGSVLYRVNAGGPQVPAADGSQPDWSEDLLSSPSPYVNTSTAGNTTFAAGTAISLDGSVPASAPTALFQSERWDSAAGAEQAWSFPVSDGTYQVNLYFAEIYTGILGEGDRVFDVKTEGITVLDNYDIVARTGDLFIGTMQSFLVDVTDGTLDIQLLHVLENPKIAAIEIRQASSGGPNAFLSADPTVLDFGPQAEGSISSSPVTLSNTGDTALDVTDIALAGPDAAAFYVDLIPPFTMEPGTSDTLIVDFMPLTAGSKSATLTLSHTGDNPVVTVDLSGQGEAVTAILQAIPSSIDFGLQAVGSASSNPVTVTNTGNTALDVTDIALNGPDAAAFSSDLTPPFSVDPGSSVILTAEFSPMTGGPKSATLTLSHNGDNPAVTVELSGQGEGLTAILQGSPSLIDFGQQPLGSVASNVVTLANTGNTTLDVTDLTITGPDAASFGFDLIPPFPVNPGSPVALTLDFSPPTEGRKSAALMISHDGDNPAVTVELSGQGVEAGSVLYRVNAGGAQVAADDGSQPPWSGDLLSSPSPYVNTGAAGNTTFISGAVVSTDGSVPAGAPSDLFQSERWDPPSQAEQTWNFPVSDGTYQVNLYFSEVFTGILGPGDRVFDVVIEGITVLDDYDIFLQTGDLFIGTMQSFFVDVTDGELTIELLHEVENPKISAIEILSGDPGPPSAILAASPALVDFGPQVEGSSSSRPVTVSNTGNIALNVTDITLTGPDAAEFGFDLIPPFTLDPGASATLTLDFTPLAAGPKSATLTLSHDGDNPAVTVDLIGQGEGLTAVLQTIPSSIDFGLQPEGSSSSNPVTLTNTGNTLLDVTDITLTGPDAAAFGFDLIPPFSVDPAAPVILTVDFAPLSAGPKSATLTLSHNGDNPAVTLDLIGQGEGLTAILQAAPSVVDFGLQAVGSTFSDSVTLTNTGNTTLNVSDITVTGPDADAFDFNLIPPFNVDPGSPVTLTADFSPLSAGPKSATLTISHDGDNAAVTIELTGEGETLAAILQASPGLVEFGQQPLGSASSNAVTLANTGDIALDVVDVAITGPDAAAFSFDLTAPFTLAPGTTEVLTLDFSPSTGGSKAATLTLSHTGDNPTVTVDLSGEGVQAGSVLYRVNAGGPQIPAGDGSQPDWSADQGFNPSPYVNTLTAGNTTFATGTAISSDGSVPAGAPASLFQSERWDSAAAAEQEWTFPVANGTYQVNLYFAEIYTGILGAGDRVFDVVIEGVTALDDYDIFAATGDLFTGTMQPFLVDVADGELNIQLLHEVENPKISAIEILAEE